PGNPDLPGGSPVIQSETQLMNGLAQRQQARCGEFTLSWREAGHGRPVVLLHGISSGLAVPSITHINASSSPWLNNPR
ncbi:hypothetical protein, partial [Rhizobium leguminosarum]|uniref:hypothetical protein n=1 Tax=Rhizobium leguminosarum TaxID=384 RepID=UPI003F98F3A0